MGRLSNEKKKQLLTEQQTQDDTKAKILGDVTLFQEGEGEVFKCEIVKASNGFILTGAGETMVFSEEKWPFVLQWIVERRLLKMKTGEEMQITLEQTFTKIIRT